MTITPQQALFGYPPDPAYSPKQKDLVEILEDAQTRLEALETTFTVLAPVDVATTGNITLSGEQAIDGITTSTSRVLVKDQVDARQNGIYISSAGTWARATDADSQAELTGARVKVGNGQSQANTQWLVNGAPVPGTDPVTFTKMALQEDGDFASRQDAVGAISGGWTLPAGMTFIADGKRYKFVDGSTVIPDMPGVEPSGAVYLEHFGVVTSATKTAPTIDYTSLVQAAANAAHGLLVFTGFVKITDMVTIPNDCQIYVPAGRTQGGFSVFSDFNMAADAIIQYGTGEAGPTTTGFTIWADQPAAPATRADLYQYPRAIAVDNVPRFNLTGIRLEQVMDGVIGVGNMGGSFLKDLELGCLGTALHLDGALDFTTISGHCEVWPYGFAANSALTAIMYDNSRPGFWFGKCDGLSIDNLSIFRGNIRIENPAGNTRLPVMIDQIKLDGNWSSLLLGDGATNIGAVYFTNDAAGDAADFDIQAFGGTHQIGRVFGTAVADSSILVQAGARLSIGDANLSHIRFDRRLVNVQTGGKCEIGHAHLSWAGGAATIEMIKATGAMYLGGLTVGDGLSASVPIVEYDIDQAGNYLDMLGAPGFDAVIPASPALGTYLTPASSIVNSDIVDISGLLSLLGVSGSIPIYDTGYSVFIGEGAGVNDDLSNNYNVFVGYYAGYSNTTGSSNSATGLNALRSNTTGGNNSAVGAYALRSNTTGGNSCAVGAYALFANTTGINNSATGVNALFSNTTGNSNTATGYAALFANTTGINNSATGVNAGRYVNAGTNNETSSNSTYIGYDTRASADGNTNETVIGYAARGNGSNTVTLGNAAITGAFVQVAWTVVSDRRDKEHVGDVPLGLDFVNCLRPAAFRYTEERGGAPSGPVRYGFYAQDVLALEDDPVIVDASDPDKLKLNETALIAALTNAVQELSAQVSDLSARLAKLEGE